MKRTTRTARTTRTVRTAVSVLAVTGLALGLGACSEAAEKAVDQVDKSVNETYEVTYEVSGSAVESIDFHAGGGTAMEPKIESEKKPATPWKKTVTLKGIMPPAVMPVSLDPPTSPARSPTTARSSRRPRPGRRWRAAASPSPRSSADPRRDRRARQPLQPPLTSGDIGLSVAWCTVDHTAGRTIWRGIHARAETIAKPGDGAETDTAPGRPQASTKVLRPHAEHAFAAELAALAAADDRPRPARWRLSPRAVATYLLGGTLPDGTVITPKYVGPRRIVEVAVTTLATDRALLLLGVPGTAKTWVSEHLAAAVSGDSTLLVQGTAGAPEEAVRYGWNYARLLAHGPDREALVPSPVMRAMSRGATVRVEELTRIPADVQDTLITILSEKTLPVPELGEEVQAVPGFNLVATANDRDRGVNELSGALRRRFNTVVLPLPATPEDEVDIVARRVEQLGRSWSCRSRRTGRPRSAGSSPSSANCGTGSPPTDARRSSPPRGRSPPPRPSPSSRAASPSPPTSATASCAPPTSPPASSAPSSATRPPTGSSGRSTWRRSSGSGTAGRTSTAPAAR